MRRVDADDGDARRRQVAAGNAEVELECTRAADDRAVRPGRMHALGRDLVEEALHALLRRRHTEVLADREDGRAELVEILDGADLERHQKSSGQYGGRDVRNNMSARSSAPSLSSRTRSAAARRVNENAPRYVDARSTTSSSISASSSVRATSRPTRQRPAFHGQNSSRSSSTTPSSLANDRPFRAPSRSTIRSHSPSLALRFKLRASTTIRKSGEAGSRRLSTWIVRSMPNRNRHSSRSATVETASASTTLTVPFGNPASHSPLTR